MKGKKVLALILALIMTMAITLTGCGQKAASTDSTSTGKKKIKVALVLSGFLGDKSFNDSCYAGIQKAQKDYGIEVKVMESKVPSDWESNLIAMASAKYDLVIGVSTQLQDIIQKHASEFPDVKFGIIDGVVKANNVESAVFAQNEGSFLAGAAAAMFTQKTNIPNVNAQKTIGWVGGADIPVLHDFLVGYEQGAKYIDPQTKVLVSFAGTFNDPLKGKELTLAQYDQGADIVMNVASNTGNGILEAAKQTNKYAIGVDLDQDAMYPGNILTSQLKRVDIASYQMVKDVVEGSFKGGQVIRENIQNGGVGLTDMSVMKKALGDKFPQDILDKITQLTNDIKSGKIKVDTYPGFKVE
jgi:basic membrane protein A